MCELTHSCILYCDMEITNLAIHHCMEKAREGYYLIYNGPSVGNKNMRFMEFCKNKECNQLKQGPAWTEKA